MNHKVHHADVSSMDPLEFGFDKDGGFYVLSHELRRAAYAYQSSVYALEARRKPVTTAIAMARFFRDGNASPEIEEEHYVHICKTASQEGEVQL